MVHGVQANWAHAAAWEAAIRYVISVFVCGLCILTQHLAPLPTPALWPVRRFPFVTGALDGKATFPSSEGFASSEGYS